ncbi:glutathione S-transferase C-terminal-like protein [Mycena metata]|uniref:Glutathione S-transferase C-terminal-like protein n=1 Tax=Mycena metata TaxID=1033252 RepID=A0AAD7JQY2_9AGAR|nr:glutathione S-transferase C-terminal-like protein [Mycena metata]
MTAAASTIGSGITLLTAATPDGYKASIALEELKAIGTIPSYSVVPTSFQKNEQKSDWFLKMRRVRRIPALVDAIEGQAPVNVWESASILLYLARVYDTNHVFHFSDPAEEQELLNGIFFLQGGFGPMQGQANHFFRYAPEKIPYAIKRYQDETHRLYSLYETRLADREYLVGPGTGKYTIADICTYGALKLPMVQCSYAWAGLSLDGFPNLKAWLERIAARPAVVRGSSILKGMGHKI